MVKVAILGFGTVGSGVAEVLTMNADNITRTSGREIGIKYIVDVREFPGNPFEKYMVKDFSLVENDPEVSIVVETIGGVGVAYEFSRRALMAGKSLITSNKELVATHGHELLSIAKEKGVNYLFEASVGGGIPVLRPLCQCLAANRIEEIYGILNGTTNYILTEMITNGVSFEEALSQAQQKGYAEQNPAADIEGHDAGRKICILSTLSSGVHIYPDYITTEGITGVTLEDVKNAEKLGCKIKLLGRAVMNEEGKPAAYVAPHLVSEKLLISGVSGVMNAIVIKGNAVNEVMFYGPGAGKMPTASAVVADIIDAAKHDKTRKLMSWEDGDKDSVADADLLVSRWYVRTSAQVPFEKIEEGVYVTEAMDKKTLMGILGDKGAEPAFRILE